MTTRPLLEALTGLAERAMDTIALRIAATVNLRIIELERQVTILRRDVDDALALAREHTTRPTISPMTGREGDGATPEQVACPLCHGRGRMPVVGEEHRPCSICSGTGRVLWDVADTEPVPWAKPEDSDV